MHSARCCTLHANQNFSCLCNIWTHCCFVFVCASNGFSFYFGFPREFYYFCYFLPINKSEKKNLHKNYLIFSAFANQEKGMKENKRIIAWKRLMFSSSNWKRTRESAWKGFYSSFFSLLRFSQFGCELTAIFSSIFCCCCCCRQLFRV